jgi:RNA polymerase sigma-70 factor (ECF subfamily)
MTDTLKQMPFEDKQLIHATLHGDNTAFGIIVERHWKMVIALALSKIDEPSEAEDIAQESFLKAYSQLHNLRNPDRFAGWLSKIVLQQCTNKIRRTVRCKTALGCNSTQLEDLDGKYTITTNPGLSQNQVHFIRQSIRRLPEKFRSLVIMRFVTGLSAVQIAEQLGKRPGTVRVWLHRAYKILRRDLAPLLEEVGK